MGNMLNVLRYRWRSALTFSLLVAAGLAFHLYAPAQHNHLRPLSLDDPIGFATYDKLTDLKHEPDTCFAALAAASVAYTQLEDVVTGEGWAHIRAEILRAAGNALNMPQQMR